MPDRLQRERPSKIESSFQYLRTYRASAQRAIRCRALAGTQTAGCRDQCGECVGWGGGGDSLCHAAGGVAEIAWFEVRHSVAWIWPEEPGSAAGGSGWTTAGVWR